MKLNKTQTKQIAVQGFRDKITSLENKLLAQQNPNIVKGNSDSFPLTHSFSDGVYIREMSMLKDGIVIGKIHNKSQTWFLMKGKIKVATENGTVVYTAPTYVNAPAGAKRVVQALEDSVFVNVHPNPDNTKDIKTLEERLTCATYEAFEKQTLKTRIV